MQKTKNLYPVIIGFVLVVFISVFLYDYLEYWFIRYKSLIDFVVILLGVYNFVYLYKLKSKIDTNHQKYNYKLNIKDYYIQLDEIRENINRLKKSKIKESIDLIEEVNKINVLLTEIKNYNVKENEKFFKPLENKINNFHNSNDKKNVIKSEIDDIYTDLATFVFSLKNEINKKYFEVENE